MNKHNARPEGLSKSGSKAYDLIMKVMGDPDTGGCRTFYSPEEWKARGEQYGCSGELIVVYDGGDVAPYFSFDYGNGKRMDEMNDALHTIGMYAEQCTNWYSAIYFI